jgi:hypothetical protein
MAGRTLRQRGGKWLLILILAEMAQTRAQNAVAIGAFDTQTTKRLKPEMAEMRKDIIEPLQLSRIVRRTW